MANHSARAKDMMASYFVGNYMDPEQEVVQVSWLCEYQFVEDEFELKSIYLSFNISVIIKVSIQISLETKYWYFYG